MKHELINIDIPWEKLGMKCENTATITTYIKDVYKGKQDPFKRPLIIICPGGGYSHHSVREGEAIALKMMDLGYNALILRYSLAPDHYPVQLYEAAYTVRYARMHAEEWDVDPDKLIMAGFSAGGHVAGLMGTKWNSEELTPLLEILGCTHEDVKVNGMLLGYPVITSGEYAHRGSFDNLLSEKTEEALDNVSLEKQVNSDTPVTFMWHTYTDGSVPLENSLLFAMSLRKAGIQFEYHMFSMGQHGLGLGSKQTASCGGEHTEKEVESWPELFYNWMEAMYE